MPSQQLCIPRYLQPPHVLQKGLQAQGCRQTDTYLTPYSTLYEGYETLVFSSSREMIYRTGKATYNALLATLQRHLSHFQVFLAAPVCRETLRK